jgi:hypothetical protein
LKTPIAVVVHVLSALTEGMGINAAARLYGVGKNSIYRWQKRLSGMKQTLLLYALTHQFLHQVIEGDELSTKVRKNVAPDESKGWTIVLMDRATRFIWEMGCGRKDRKLFTQAIRQLCRVMKQTGDLTLLTEGERRYGNILFEICHQVLRKGTRGRPKKTLRKGIKVRLKNKGAQAHTKGRKRPKYQAPFPEHPETINWLRVFRNPGASRTGHRRRQQQHTRAVWPEKCGGLRGTAWHKMQVITEFFGSGARAALPGHRAAFFSSFKELARCTKLATSHNAPAKRGA